MSLQEGSGSIKVTARWLGWKPRGLTGSAYSDAALLEFAALGQKLVNNVKAVAPVSPFKSSPGPHLRDTVHAIIEASQKNFNMKIDVGDGIDYLRLVIDGFDGIIKPQSAQVLHFKAYTGEEIFAPEVLGQQANPFNLLALMNSQADIEEASRKMVMAATRKFAENFI